MWGRAVVGFVLCAVGTVWILQGTEVIQGSGMSGKGQVGGYWSSGCRSGIGVFCVGCQTPPKRHDRGKLKGR